MKRIEVWLQQTSEPLIHQAKNSYIKGPMYCIYCANETVYKYPVMHIFCVIEEYGTHSSETLNTQKQQREDALIKRLAAGLDGELGAAKIIQ